MKRSRFGVAIVAAAVMIVLGTASQAYAAVYDNRGVTFNPFSQPCAGSSRSYFDNACYDWDNGSGAGFGYVLPHYQYNTNLMALQPVWDQRGGGSNAMRDALINLLSQYRNGWGNMKTATGAAFIIQTMLGRDGDQANANGGRNISNGDWNELVARLNQSTFVVSNTYIGAPDTGGDYPYDVDFTWTNAAPSGTYLYIQQNGQTKYVLDFQCANPIGGLAGLAHMNQWSTSGWSKIGVGANQTPNVTQWPAAPGATLHWQHGIVNNGPDTAGAINFSLYKSGFSAGGWNNSPPSPQGGFSGLGAGRTEVLGYNAAWPAYSTYTVSQDDVGKTLCEWVGWSPSTESGGANTSNQACANIPYNFTLKPSIDSSIAGAAVEPGSTLSNIIGTVANSGPTKSYDTTQWEIGKFVLAPGKGLVNGADGTAQPCGYVASQGGTSCTTLKSGNGPDANGSFYPPSRSFTADPYQVEDLPLGAHVCFIMSVTKYDTAHGGDNQWRYGTPVCVVVGKKPKLEVWGGDVATRGAINVSLTQKQVNNASAVFGSWVEYGAFAVKQNSMFGSGSGLSTTQTPATNPNQNGWSGLTFANVDGNGNAAYGNYGSMRDIPAIDQFFGAMGNTAPYQSSGNLVANSFNTGDSVQVRTAVDLTLGNDKLPAGKSVVIVASGTVTINGDLTYDDNSGKLTQLNQLPQLVIIAKNIAITGGASNIDAWLIARNGYIDTCSDVTQGSMPPNGTGLTGSVCNAPLVVHGPVVASQLFLKRTGGSGTGPVDSGAPAEVFDLRGDAYLWAHLVAGGAGKAQTVYTTELPPRF